MGGSRDALDDRDCSNCFLVISRMVVTYFYFMSAPTDLEWEAASGNLMHRSVSTYLICIVGFSMAKIGVDNVIPKFGFVAGFCLTLIREWAFIPT